MAPKKRARSDDAELAAARAAEGAPEPSTTQAASQAADGPDRRGDMADIARR